MRFLKFEKTGCMPCRKMDKILNSLEVEVEHINVDDEVEDLIEQYSISTLPTLVKIKDDGFAKLNGIQHTMSEFKEFCEV